MNCPYLLVSLFYGGGDRIMSQSDHWHFEQLAAHSYV
jgi:hypothetical protein